MVFIEENKIRSKFDQNSWHGIDIDTSIATIITNNSSLECKLVNKHINLTKIEIEIETKPTTEKDNYTRKKIKLKNK